MRLIFHGELRKKFGSSFEMKAASVREAVEGFSRQVEWPKDIPVHLVAEGKKLTDENDFEEYRDELHVVPAMVGGGGKFFKIVVGAVLVVAGVLIGGPIGTALIVNGALMILSGVLQLFMKAPSSKNVDNPEDSKYLPINRNTTANGTLITMAWGRIDLAGHWLSLQSDSNNLSQGSFPAVPA